MANGRVVGFSAEKVDGLSLATGTGIYADDYRLPADVLHVAILYSPYADADILDIDTSGAEALDGVVDVLSCRNVYDEMPRVLYTTAGQGFPEPSPYDFCFFDSRVRYVGDRVAAVAAESRDIAREAVGRIRVQYRQREHLFDPEYAMEKGVHLVHDGDEMMPIPAPYHPERNIAAEVSFTVGDLAEGFRNADFTEEHRYTTQYASHCMMEPHAASAHFDERGRLVIVSSTQVPFHVRRIVSRVLSIPVGRIHVVKPRVGGAFGGKQEVILEPLVACFALRTGRPVKAVLSRKEVFISARTRHPMRVHIRAGVKDDGTITAMAMDDVMTAGAYGSHGLTVLSNAASKVLPLFNKIENIDFRGRTVYTNQPVGGAYRGYGATQAIFALMQHIDMIARRTGQDVLKYIKKWHIKEGETSPVFAAIGEGKAGVAQIVRSCKLSECIDRGADAIDWYAKRGRHIDVGGNRVKGVGMAVSMQGSGIPLIDMGSASMKMNEDGSFNLLIGATDTGTGSDTVMSQIAAEVLEIPASNIIVLSSDTDVTPFDDGAYASSGTYISGGAVKKCAEAILEEILKVAAEMLDVGMDNLVFGDERVWIVDDRNRCVSFGEIARYSLYTADQHQIQAQASYVSPYSPPPFAAQFAEVDVDVLTGRITVVRLVNAVDCGRPINPLMAQGQVEGGSLNGLSFALTEEYLFDGNGRMTNPGFGDYKIFGTTDIPEIDTILVDSAEDTGPFGAKSIAEVCINGPGPAVANALYDAVGVRIFDQPLTPEKILRAIRKKKL